LGDGIRSLGSPHRSSAVQRVSAVQQTQACTVDAYTSTTQLRYRTHAVSHYPCLSFCLPTGYGTESQEGPCTMCPSGYYRDGHARAPCLPCPFGMTSPAGAILGECVPMAQPCPVGQIVDPQDEPVSVQDCHCLPGFGGGSTAVQHTVACRPSISNLHSMQPALRNAALVCAGPLCLHTWK
jgi:hypothetical protein